MDFSKTLFKHLKYFYKIEEIDFIKNAGENIFFYRLVLNLFASKKRSTIGPEIKEKIESCEKELDILNHFISYSSGEGQNFQKIEFLFKETDYFFNSIYDNNVFDIEDDEILFSVINSVFEDTIERYKSNITDSINNFLDFFYFISTAQIAYTSDIGVLLYKNVGPRLFKIAQEVQKPTYTLNILNSYKNVIESSFFIDSVFSHLNSIKIPKLEFNLDLLCEEIDIYVDENYEFKSVPHMYDNFINHIKENVNIKDIKKEISFIRNLKYVVIKYTELIRKAASLYINSWYKTVNIMTSEDENLPDYFNINHVTEKIVISNANVDPNINKIILKMTDYNTSLSKTLLKKLLQEDMLCVGTLLPLYRLSNIYNMIVDKKDSEDVKMNEAFLVFPEITKEHKKRHPSMYFRTEMRKRKNKVTKMHEKCLVEIEDSPDEVFNYSLLGIVDSLSILKKLFKLPFKNINNQPFKVSDKNTEIIKKAVHDCYKLSSDDIVNDIYYIRSKFNILLDYIRKNNTVEFSNMLSADSETLFKSISSIYNIYNKHLSSYGTFSADVASEDFKKYLEDFQYDNDIGLSKYSWHDFSHQSSPGYRPKKIGITKSYTDINIYLKSLVAFNNCLLDLYEITDPSKRESFSKYTADDIASNIKKTAEILTYFTEVDTLQKMSNIILKALDNKRKLFYDYFRCDIIRLILESFDIEDLKCRQILD